jgi:hypothetical protein
MNIEANTSKKQDKMIFFILASSFLRICKGCRGSMWNRHARDTDVSKRKITQSLLFFITLIAVNNSINAKNGTSGMEISEVAANAATPFLR